ncbi:MAG TPA: VacJ family lipoprotein [Tepidisphaeraceae bacterium]|jgi:phospholipid-binding lipoprotein MlaA|nr:VacJ family lipoprotein [Tepidisphaeraceae bacterium]
MPSRIFWRVAVLCLAFAFFILCGGCAHNPKNPDPFEKCNRFIYKVNDGLDKILLKPASDFYTKVVPKPVRHGLGNFFDNLSYGNVILNDFLQGHIKDGLASTVRMGVNSTVGVAGVFDVATKWNLPGHSNDFGITIGKWGGGPGPYLVLPLYGPSTFRDVPRIPVGMYTNVLHYVDLPDYVSIPLDVLNLAEDRARANAAINFRDDAAIDPYIFMREAYLQYRRIKIYGAPPPVEPGFYDEDEGPTTRPSTRPIAQAGE